MKRLCCAFDYQIFLFFYKILYVADSMPVHIRSDFPSFFYIGLFSRIFYYFFTIPGKLNKTVYKSNSQHDNLFNNNLVLRCIAKQDCALLA